MALSPLVWQNSLLTFVLSILLGAVLGFITVLPFYISILLLLLIILIGVLADMFGVAVAAADEGPLHAMAADRVPGSAQAIRLIRQADRVTNISNDVIGDVAGTVGGALTVGIAFGVATAGGLSHNLVQILAIALTAAITVGGKALGKVYALRHPHTVIISMGRFLFWLGLPGHTDQSRRRRARERAKKEGKT